MDVSVSVSFFQDELASTIEHAVKAAVDTVLCEVTKIVGSKFTEFQMEMAGKEKENESLKLRLEISECELKALRQCISAADANIIQALCNMNTDSNEQDVQISENRALLTRFQDIEERRAFNEAEEGPVIEAGQEDIFDQEWCGSIMEITGLTIVESIEVPELEPVHITAEALELESVHITEEVFKENEVNTTEENIVKVGSSHCDDGPPKLACMKHNQSVSEDTCSSVGEEGTVLGSIQRKHHPPQERAADGKKEGAMPSTSSTASEALELESVHITEEVFKENEVNTTEENIVKVGSSHCDDGPPKLACMKHNQSVSEDTCSSVGEEGTVLGSIQRKHHPPQERAADGKKEGAMPSTSSTACTEVKPMRELDMEPVHINEEATELEPAHIKDKLNYCNPCGKSFTLLGNFKKHQLMHKGEKPYNCNECGRSFTRLGNLKIHKRFHTGEKPNHCNECEKTFTKLQCLKYQQTHPGEKSFHCTECEKTFSDSGNLKKHNQTHTGEKPYHCIECGKRCIQLGHLKKHQQKTPYQCTECMKCFKYLKSFKKHQQKHTAETS
ncbi:UNVERIFIED_CONTAM: hypothetical protein FKN15_066320 [Acipenser sinensis]